MSVNRITIRNVVKMVGADHTRCIVKLAGKQDAIENQWLKETKNLHDKIVYEILGNYASKGKADLSNKVFIEFLFEHYLAVSESAVESAEIETKIIAPRLAARPPIPKSLRDLRIMWDRYRKTGRVPKGLKDRAEKIKDQYLKKTQSVWRKYSEDFRNGDTYTQENVLRKVKEAADTVEARAKTIVRTETTRYYNETRREIYDESSAITHYLFLAIRDKATTKWCKSRHGLVFKKETLLLKKNTPPCHFNCRSEIVPLTPFNPRHKKLIEDKSLAAENVKIEPLMRGWNS